MKYFHNDKKNIFLFKKYTIIKILNNFINILYY